MVADLPISYATVGPSFGATVSIRRVMPSTIRCTPSAPNSNCRFASTPGSPVHPIPGEVQNPIHLDRVCVRFPELKLCMIHGADPVGRGDPDAHQIPEPAADDVCVVAQTPARQPVALRTCGPNKVIFWPGLAGSVQRRVIPRGT